ncbi:PstS family phosphate ABC transporter substrate-binding protein [Caldimonas taiwanensis]|uniref:PstS family phosphate ABC transporter substrate-binding protein n=1 Tax=Caldimonas taiwanensis TaxID=307483 RepID=UPI0007857903|nr:PstS family phosphate ABC transporter substrate-binding protein [Caldimonas taiwanensis]
MKALAQVAAAAAVLAALAGPGVAEAQTPIVKIDGSSTVFPPTEGVAEDFQKAKKGAVRVTVGISGTGGGFKKFCRGETDISNASRPILKQEMEACRAAGIEYFELPVGFDALTVVIHPKNNFVKQLSVAELKTMWEPAAQGKITLWSQINPAFPAEKIVLYGAGSDSGTFDYFTEAINGKAKSSRGDYAATEDDHVTVKGVSGNVYALGYLGYAYYAENRKDLKAVPIVAKPGSPAVEPNETNVINGTYQPLSRPIFIYVNAKAYERPEVKEFVDFYMKNASRIMKEVKYVPLPEAAYKMNLEHLAKNRKGTVFGGVAEVGVTIDELMRREASL